MTDPQADVLKQAQDIVRYETQEKGAFGSVFNWEVRDGFFAKAYKAIGVSLYGIAAASLTVGAMASMPLAAGIAASFVAAYAGITIGGAIERKVMSEIHDSSKSNLGKFSHLLGAWAPSILAGILLIPASILVSPIAELGIIAASNLAYVGSAIGIKKLFGNAELRQTAEQSRNLAEQAMAQGVSPELLIGNTQHQSQRAAAQNPYHNSVTSAEYAQLQSRMAAQGNHSASMAETVLQQRERLEQNAVESRA